MGYVRRRYCLMAVLLLIVLLISSGCKKADSKEIKIGVIVPLTGPLAVYGEGVRDGALLAFEKINEAGGIDGKKIKAIVEDNKADGAETANALDRKSVV